MKRIVLVLMCLFLLVGCSNNSNEEKVDKEKISSEIEFFSSKIANLLNSLNNITLNNYELASQKIEMNKSSGGSGESGESQSSSQGRRF